MQTEKMKVLLYLKKSSLDKLGEAPIMGRITYGRTMAQFSCKLSCPPHLWNPRESRLDGKSRQAVVLNAKLDSLLVAVQSAYQNLCAHSISFTAGDIKEAFQGSMQSRIGFLERYDLLIEQTKGLVGIELKENSVKIYHITRKHLQNFIMKEYNLSDLAFSQMTDDFLCSFEHYAEDKFGLSQGYYRKMALLIKKVCRLAYREGICDRLLFENMKIESDEKKLPRGLDNVSLDKLAALTFDEYASNLEQTRDLFLFSCYTGVAYCDMVSLSKGDLYQDDEHALWLKFRRQKTNTLCRIKLLPEAVSLIKRYKSETRGGLFAPIPYYTYLLQLKALGLKAGISIPLSAHVGRHTFATLITLENGIPIETVSRMLGHRNIRTTERYAHVTPTKLFDEFERFLDFTKELSLSL